MNEFSESNEQRRFDLRVVIMRHSVKEGMEGALSPYGMQKADDHFSALVRNSESEEGRQWRVASSPKERAAQTAQIQQAVREYMMGEESDEIETVDALNEGAVEDFARPLLKEKKDWLKMWHNGEGNLPPGLLPMKDVARNFTRWLLEEIKSAKRAGGAEGIRAFSHGPLMFALLSTIEDETGQSIITDIRAGDDRFNREKILDMETGVLRALQSLEFEITSKDPANVRLSIMGKSLLVPMTIFEKMAR